MDKQTLNAFLAPTDILIHLLRRVSEPILGQIVIHEFRFFPQVRHFAASDAPHAAAERSRSDQLAVQAAVAARTEAARPKRQRPGRPGHLSRQALEAMRPAVPWRPPPKVCGAL
jgi:hypothetical protein